MLLLYFSLFFVFSTIQVNKDIEFMLKILASENAICQLLNVSSRKEHKISASVIDGNDY